MKIGRFIVDTHVHSQRFAAGPGLREKLQKDADGATYGELGSVIRELEAYDNSPRLLYDMETYGVDMCVLLPAFGMSNELNVELVERHPDKFVAVANAKETAKRAMDGEIEWTAQAAAEELDDLLSTGKFVGIGEGMPSNNTRRTTVSQTERMDEIRCIMDVARKHQTVAQVHSGSVMGYTMSYHHWPETLHPMWVTDMAAEYKDVPIVLNHGGVQGWWSERFHEECLLVAAAHDNVYLECGFWWTDLYWKALIDPNIGPEKLIWGTDWGASIPFHSQIGHKPPAYAVQLRKQKLVRHQVDMWGWSLKQLNNLDIVQDDLNLILGGNAARIYKLTVPHNRLFRPVGKELNPQPEGRISIAPRCC
jgi:predicted TIM-barrel fold metal-dependent hydrolase